MNAETNLLEKNGRYRIIHMSGEYYILDMEKTQWLLFIPLLLWLTPQKVYKVNAEVVEELRAPASYSKSQKRVVWLGAGGASVLTPLVQPLLDETIGSSIIVNLLLLIILTTIIITLRLYLRKSLHNKLYKTVDLEALETRLIRIWPRYFIQYINPFIFILFIGFWIVAMFPLFLKTSNLIPMIVYLIMLPMLLISNMFFIDSRSEKRNVYRVSIVD